MKKQYRQGDVFLNETTKTATSKQSVPRENGRVVLAHGEATGHHHSYGGKGVAMFREDGSGSGLHLQVTTVSDLQHQEHDTIQTPVGDYEVIRQREWDAAGYARKVAD